MEIPETVRRKVGDRVQVKSKYFTQFNDMTGEITSIDHYYYFTVKIDEEWAVEGLQVFQRQELKGMKP